MGAISVVGWDPGWATVAAELIAELRSGLPLGTWQQLEHIGSTSVPGLAAKPVIDLMGSTADIDALRRQAGSELTRLGYTLTETGMTGRLFYRRPSDPSVPTLTVHLHVVQAKEWASQNERILRDFLLDHPDAARRYGDLKQSLAATMDDPLQYTRAKTALIQELVDQARVERGLPHVEVWPD